jgi:hypothetical protein
MLEEQADIAVDEGASCGCLSARSARATAICLTPTGAQPHPCNVPTPYDVPVAASSRIQKRVPESDAKRQTT